MAAPVLFAAGRFNFNGQTITMNDKTLNIKDIVQVNMNDQVRFDVSFVNPAGGAGSYSVFFNPPGQASGRGMAYLEAQTLNGFQIAFRFTPAGGGDLIPCRPGFSTDLAFLVYSYQ